MSSPPHSEPNYDPVFLHSRREALVIFSVWLVTMLWAVPYCYRYGYLDSFDPADMHTVWGVPSWLFWGIGVPWLLADIFTTWFCFFYMCDDDLGETAEGADIKEDRAKTGDDSSSVQEGGS